MKITPEQIRSQFVDNKIQKSMAISNLISIVEQSEFQKERVKAMRILEELEFKGPEIYNLFESLLISENNDLIRKIAAEIIGDNFLLMGLKPLIWALHHESVKTVLDVIYSNIIEAVKILEKEETDQFNQILQDLINNMDKKDFIIPLQSLTQEKDLNTIPSKELGSILINYFTLIYLEKAFWRIKYKVDKFQIIKLNFMFKGLIKIPEPLRNLNALQSLIFRYNQINFVPNWIGNFKELEVLNFNINELTILPESIGKLSSLKELYLWKNDIETLPKSIGSLKSLKILNIRLNYLRSLPPTIGQLDSLEVLNLHDNKLVFLPPSIGTLQSIKHLNLSWNKIEQLPHTIGSLSTLKKLDLGKNKLKTIPKVIGNLRSLEILNLSENKLSSLPDSLINLDHLESLNLFRNKLNELPEGLTNLGNLKELYLGGNNLDQYSEQIQQLKSNGVKVYF